MDLDSLQESFFSYLRDERGLAASTCATYSHHVRAHLNAFQKQGIAVETARSEDVTEYLARLHRRGLKSAPRFCATVAIRTFYRFLVAKGIASSDPTAGLRLPRLTTHISEPLSPVEVEKLLSAPSKCGFTGVRDQAILELLCLGLRIGEVVQLDVQHIHLEQEYIKIRGKGDKERLVPLGKMATESLKRYIRARDARFAMIPALFLATAGRRLTKNGLWRRFKCYAAKAGITRRVYPHLLRHTCATRLLEGRADLRSIQLLLGHASLAVTQRYLSVDLNSLRETCRRAHPRF